MTKPMHPKLQKLLSSIADPLSDVSLVAAKRVLSADLAQGEARVILEIPQGQATAFEPVRAGLEHDLKKLWGVKRATVILTAASAPPAPKRDPHPQPTGGKPAGVTHVIAVTSAKGGVGKSTVAVNLAVALQRQGLRVGLLDADVYGPSAPTMLGLSGKASVNADKQLVPFEAHVLKVLSMGLVTPKDAAMIWRGPMASGAALQLLSGAAWGTLDVLIVDMPPGTGDVQLTLCQKAGFSGAVVVSTPQEVALADVRRGLGMFEKLNIPILGVIENMAWFEDANGARIPIFGTGGAKALAADIGAPFLGEVPIDIELRAASDTGAPLGGDTAAAKRFADMAATLSKALNLSEEKLTT